MYKNTVKAKNPKEQLTKTNSEVATASLLPDGTKVFYDATSFLLQKGVKHSKYGACDFGKNK